MRFPRGHRERRQLGGELDLCMWGRTVYVWSPACYRSASRTIELSDAGWVLRLCDRHFDCRPGRGPKRDLVSGHTSWRSYRQSLIDAGVLTEADLMRSRRRLERRLRLWRLRHPWKARADARAAREDLP